MSKVICLLALCACATTTPVRQDPSREKTVAARTPASPPPEGKVICTLERPTGSNIAERVCRYVNQNDWSSARTQDMLHDMQRIQMCNDLGCPKGSSGNR